LVLARKIFKREVARGCIHRRIFVIHFNGISEGERREREGRGRVNPRAFRKFG